MNSTAKRVFLLTSVTFTFLSISQLRAADWPRFMGPDRNARSPETKLMNSWPEAGPEVLWTVQLGPGFAAPAVHNNQVFLLDRVNDQQDVLRCFDFTDGSEIWQAGYDAPGKFSNNGSRSTPTVDDQYVFTIGPLGHLHAFSRQTQKPLWHKNILDEFGGKPPTWAVSQSPLLYKDMVIVAPQGPDAGVVALRKDNGQLIWKTEAIGAMSYASPDLMTIAGIEQVVMLSNKGLVSSFAVTDGRKLWEYQGWNCAIPITNPLYVGNGRIFITGGYGAGSVMIQVSKNDHDFTVAELDKTQDVGAQIHIPLLYQDHLYINSNDNKRRDGLACFSLDGKLIWKTERTPFFERGGLLLADAKIYIMDGTTGILHLVKPTPEGYSELAQAKLLDGKQIWAPLVLSDGKLLIRDQTQMKCVRIR